MKDTFLTRDQAAEYLEVTPGTLKVWATTKKRKLPFYKPSGRALYKKSDLDKYIESTRSFRG